MAMRMLIDARHREETRVAVLNGTRIEEFDFESSEHKQIKGNIYLAKVTRVEPSLQAAFVDFGGNRHGFLAFGEIHPDYYQIPAQDRAALIAEEQAHAEEEAALREAEEDEDEAAGRSGRRRGLDDDDRVEEDGVEEIDTSEKDEIATIEDGRVEEEADDDDDAGLLDEAEAEADGSFEEAADNQAGIAESGEGERREGERAPRAGRRGRNRRQGGGRSRGAAQDNDPDAERDGGGSERAPERAPERARAKEIDDLRAKRQELRRRYKIQDVIQRRQVLLVQVVKEERGNKGAALTTYLSLAGRYCVLMPNSSHGGGISRKISSGPDRKRLKQIVGELTLPRSMGLIVRTAGLERTKVEIKRDFDYLARLWDTIRETTLASSAPAMIHSDSDLVKRAIRDIYNRDIEEVVVEGEEGYTAARQFMKLLMPSHVKKVRPYSDPVPLFQRYGAEDQLTAMYDPVVQLKSGGYLVINPTEALVSIDINSGRSTKEHGIEATALNTNLEAAREIARQLRLRDMAGLVVIDFIDMENSSSVRKVEKAMKDALRNDRARIQVGRISSFGLMEMSRQRLRTGVLEATTRTCPHCDGTGLVRTASSAGLSALRLIEEEAARGRGSVITLFASTEAAVYLLNAKRADLAEIEERYHVAVEVLPEGEDEGAKMRIVSSGPRPLEAPRFAPIAALAAEEDADLPEDDEDDEDADGDEDQEGADAEADARVPAQARAGAEPAAPRERNPAGERSDDDDAGRKKRRRRRRGGRGRSRTREEGGEEGRAEDRSEDAHEANDEFRSDEPAAEEVAEGGERSDATGDEMPAERGRRRRSGRRRGRAPDGAAQAALELDGEAVPHHAADAPEPAIAARLEPMTQVEEATPAELPQREVTAETEDEQPGAAKPARRASRSKATATGEEAVDAPGSAPEPASKPRSRRRKAEPAAAAEAIAEPAEPAAGSKPATTRGRRKAATAPADQSLPKPPAAAVTQVTAPAEAEPEVVAPAPESGPVSGPVSGPAPDSGLRSGEAAEPAGVAAADDAARPALQAADAQPRRGGWWQRTFGT